MPNRATRESGALRGRSETCTDPVVGAILAGWRYDISNITPAMRTDYEQHLNECGHCRHSQRRARTIDLLLITISSLSILAFLLAAVLVHRIHHVEALRHLSGFHLPIHHRAITISLEVVALAGLVVSIVLWTLVAIATPVPGMVSSVVQQRFSRHAQHRA